MRLASFLVGFLTAVLMLVLCIVGIVLAAARPEAHGAAALIYCGPLLLLPFAGWALAEWLSFRNRETRHETQAALCSAAFGGLLLFVGAAGLTQGDGAPPARGAEAVLAVLLAIGAWLTLSGILRLRAVNATLSERAAIEDEAGEEADAQAEGDKGGTP